MHSTYQGGDPSDYPQASVGFDYDAIDQHECETEFRRRSHTATETVTVQDALLRMISFIIDSSDYKRKVDVIVVGAGLALLMGNSYTDLARKHGVSKQAFDKEVLKFQKEFNLPVTRAQKSPQARLSYQKTQLERLERHRQQRQQRKENPVWQSSLRKGQKVPSAG